MSFQDLLVFCGAQVSKHRDLRVELNSAGTVVDREWLKREKLMILGSRVDFTSDLERPLATRTVLML
jgi:hypothetical protein